MLRHEILNNIKKFHKGYWFTPDTMAFFNSKVYEGVVEMESGFYFISSEKNQGMPRRYTVRHMSKETGNISSFSEFQQFRTKRQAEKWVVEVTGITNFIA